MNRPYEALIILGAAGTDAEVARAVAQLEELMKKLGGTIASSKGLGRRRLAYRIAKQQEGYYHLLEFELPTGQVDELKRLLRLNETVVRFLILNRSDHRPARAERREAGGPSVREASAQVASHTEAA